MELLQKLPKRQLRKPLKNKEVLEVKDNDLIFQALSWYGDDFEKEGAEDMDDMDGDVQKNYEIYIHGLTEEGKTVCVRALGFTPYFYVEVQDKWNSLTLNAFYKELKFRLGRSSYGLVGKQLVSKTKLYPFTNNKKFKFVRLVFNNMGTFNRCRYMFNKPIRFRKISKTEIQYNLFESNVHPINRFCHVKDVTTTGWIRLRKGKFHLEKEQSFGDESDGDDSPLSGFSEVSGGSGSESDMEIEYNPEIYSRAQIAVNVDYRDVRPFLQIDGKPKKTGTPYDKIAPIKIMSYDIETESFEGGFPDPKNPKDYIAQIGITFWRYGSTIKCEDGTEKSDRFHMVITRGPCDPVKGAFVIPCTSEEELLKVFCNLVEVADPDIITGYNIWGFDDSYVWTRLMRYGLTRLYGSKFSRIIKVPTTLKEKSLSSGAFGDNKFKFIEPHGRETFDLYEVVKRDYKLESNKLDFVGEHFTGQNKIDLAERFGRDKRDSYKVMFELLKGTPADIAIVAEYCVQDTNLVVEIMERQSVISNYIEMAKATYVPITWLLTRGQQCRIFSLIAKEAREKDYVIPAKIKGFEGVPFVGATVLNPKRGLYYDAIAGLDFASLYPSIMIAFNLCYSSLVIDEEFMNLPQYKYENVVVEGEYKVKGKKTGETYCFNFTFVQHKDFDGNIVGPKGILPDILERLWEGRKATKKEMYKEADPYRKMVLNGKQMAQKVVMNSIYGFTGAPTNSLHCQPIASSVTSKGREMIEQTVELSQDYYDCTVIYGDSIPEYEKVFFKTHLGKESHLSINDVSQSLRFDYEKKWKEYRNFKSLNDKGINRFNKQQLDLTDDKEPVYTKTVNGWKKINRVIRHNAPGKKLYRVKAKDPKTGEIKEVVITEGHSLILDNGEKVEAKDLKVGSTLIKVND